MIILILIGFAMIALVQIPGLVRKNWRRELICFSALWALGLVLSIFMATGTILPPVSTIISHSVSKLLGM